MGKNPEKSRHTRENKTKKTGKEIDSKKPLPTYVTLLPDQNYLI